jgi:hypothetical protein
LRCGVELHHLLFLLSPSALSLLTLPYTACRPSRPDVPHPYPYPYPLYRYRPLNSSEHSLFPSSIPFLIPTIPSVPHYFLLSPIPHAIPHPILYFLLPHDSLPEPTSNITFRSSPCHTCHHPLPSFYLFLFYLPHHHHLPLSQPLLSPCSLTSPSIPSITNTTHPVLLPPHPLPSHPVLSPPHPPIPLFLSL